MFDYLGLYKREITALLRATPRRATQAVDPGDQHHAGRSTTCAPPTRSTPRSWPPTRSACPRNRSNPYPEPGAYSQLARGLPTVRQLPVRQPRARHRRWRRPSATRCSTDNAARPDREVRRTPRTGSIGAALPRAGTAGPAGRPGGPVTRSCGRSRLPKLRLVRGGRSSARWRVRSRGGPLVAGRGGACWRWPAPRWRCGSSRRRARTRWCRGSSDRRQGQRALQAATSATTPWSCWSRAKGKGDLQRTLLSPDLGRLIKLEGCLSGNVPARGLRELPARCRELAKLKPAKVVFGPGTFINTAVGQINDELVQRQQAGSEQQADQAAEAARKALRPAGRLEGRAAAAGGGAPSAGAEPVHPGDAPAGAALRPHRPAVAGQPGLRLHARVRQQARRGPSPSRASPTCSPAPTRRWSRCG